ncbi:Flp family type IVb pilin [Micromonospora mirobrigensis]|uniref:Flp/Fap pilin component n=1 Tax=Micromonospora mirobrigensis TaxID=262898 RepID=A0A1C5ACA6_9ACTN|nr:Flp family type IVb pilin [Micromonospora mirobrigensis]SCF42855.1 Flp/Fap pilin component [Micromonospora mirobrigensis]
MLEFIHRVMAWHQTRDRGASAVEYALILALVVGGVVALYFAIGGNIQDRLGQACRQITQRAAC